MGAGNKGVKKGEEGRVIFLSGKCEQIMKSTHAHFEEGILYIDYSKTRRISWSQTCDVYNMNFW